MSKQESSTAEEMRLAQDERREGNWKRWGSYLSERQWGTVREDYSADGDAWGYFPHEQARSRAYRWGEDGLLGICDRECRLCFALALWNDRDPILKERLFGLGGPEGNHGEDVKECYYYLDATPTHSYMKGLYKYPQGEFPYLKLVEENARRTRKQPEYELVDTGVFEGNRYFDVVAEYAKRSPNDILIRLTVTNRGAERAVLHLLPTLWFRNTWSWGCTHEGCTMKPLITAAGKNQVKADHPSLGVFHWEAEMLADANQPVLLFTDNETDARKLFGAENYSPYVKDGFDQYIVHGDGKAVNPANRGTKVAAYYLLEIGAGQSMSVRLRLYGDEERPGEAFGGEFEETFAARKAEAEAFYARRIPEGMSGEEKNIARQAYAGLLWSKQFYHYIVKDWLEGDPWQPTPPPQRWKGRNHDWQQLYSRDVLSMPDKWEYPWFAAWDLAFHMIPFARIDPAFAKQQLVLLLREWYMHPNGELPAYEFAFGDVNPPMHAWACWRIYKMTGPRGKRDRMFLERTFQKLLMNFTWWVNRKDILGKHIFSGGFLGLDNIGVFDRSKPLPTGGHLEQADGTAWMAFYCGTMLSMALELALDEAAYEDIASKFFEHFVAIADAMNTVGGTGLWNEQDGFYYDQIQVDGRTIPLGVRSIVGLIPLLTAEVLESEVVEGLPGFKKRMNWFLENRADLARHITYMEGTTIGKERRYLLAIPSHERLGRVLRYLLDEKEFLSPYGIRSLSRYHKDHPFSFKADGKEYGVRYAPGDSDSGLFGGNSNWRGPVWFPVNYLLVEALERYYHFYGDSYQVEYPTGSGKKMNLREVARNLEKRLVGLFVPDGEGRRPSMVQNPYANEAGWKELVLFYECFNGDNGRGTGADHQTGWTALVTKLLEDLNCGGGS